MKTLREITWGMSINRKETQGLNSGSTSRVRGYGEKKVRRYGKKTKKSLEAMEMRRNQQKRLNRRVQ